MIVTALFSGNTMYRGVTVCIGILALGWAHFLAMKRILQLLQFRISDTQRIVEESYAKELEEYTEKLEEETIKWCKEILENSPMAIRCLKAALNADCDGQAGLQELAGNATMLFYMTDEGQEGRNAFVDKRKPDFSKYPRRP